MSRSGSDDVWKLYEATAADYVRDRVFFIGEDRFLEPIATALPVGAAVLDLGCGGGVPIAEFFIERGFDVTGVDAVPAMIAVCRTRFPATNFVLADMRKLALDRRFQAIVAWDSFFHLPPADQRSMFPILHHHAAPGGFLLFTSGPAASEAIGDLYGHALYHASLDEAEYRRLLMENGFEVISYSPEDPDCGCHTVWLARHR